MNTAHPHLGSADSFAVGTQNKFRSISGWAMPDRLDDATLRPLGYKAVTDTLHAIEFFPRSVVQLHYSVHCFNRNSEPEFASLVWFAFNAYLAAVTLH